MSGARPAFESLKADWLSYQEALDAVLGAARRMPSVDMPAARAAGCSLASPVIAGATLPAWPNSAMDGFAVRGDELTRAGQRLPVAGRAYPGATPLRGVPQGAAVRIMTGGPLPAGFDTVIRVEHTDAEAEPGFVVVGRLDDRFRHVRAAGKDMVAGDATLPTGAVVHSGSVPMILASGAESVAVFRRPRVGVLSSGDELVGPDRFDLVAQGRAIPDTNRAMIAAAVTEAGGAPVDMGVAPDDEGALRGKLQGASGIDVLVSTGGASMGEKDLLKRILLGLDFRLAFWRARLRPGSPVSFGSLGGDDDERAAPAAAGAAADASAAGAAEARGGLPVFCLPGNPASAFVTFHVLVAPFLRSMLGSAKPLGTVVEAATANDLASPPGLTQFQRVGLATGDDGRPVCALTGPQGSGLVRSLPGAEGLAIVPEGTARVREGDRVQVLLLPARQ